MRVFLEESFSTLPLNSLQKPALFHPNLSLAPNRHIAPMCMLSGKFDNKKFDNADNYD